MPPYATAYLILEEGQDHNIMSQDYLNKQVYIFCIIQENPRETHTTKGPSMSNNLKGWNSVIHTDFEKHLEIIFHWKF